MLFFNRSFSSKEVGILGINRMTARFTITWGSRSVQCKRPKAQSQLTAQSARTEVKSQIFYKCKSSQISLQVLALAPLTHVFILVSLHLDIFFSWMLRISCTHSGSILQADLNKHLLQHYHYLCRLLDSAFDTCLVLNLLDSYPVIPHSPDIIINIMVVR